MGRACHEALEEVVTDRGASTDWPSDIEAALLRALDRLRADADVAGAAWSNAPVAAWPGYRIRLARLRRATARLCALLDEAGGEISLIREEALIGLDGKLRGTPDLVVRAARAHWLIDYKTGPVLSQDGDGVRDSYVRQLQLYAVLEHEASGTWPQRAILLPLGGPAVDVDVHPDSCEEVATHSMALLESYDRARPTDQPASPSPEVCGSCPYATRCRALWEALDETWEGLVAVTGTVTEAIPTQLGGVSFAVEVRAGTVATERVSVRNVLVSEHPTAATARPGDELALVGLRKERGEETWSLPPWGRMRVESGHAQVELT